MKNKRSIVLTASLLVFCFSLSVSAQVTGGAYSDKQENVVLAATVGEEDFKPFETRMLSKGTWEVQAIKVEGVPEKRLARTSWQTISNDWAGGDCNGKNQGYTTTFYISAVGTGHINSKWSNQYGSRRCRTQALAIKEGRLKKWTFKLEQNSLVTFFLGAFYDTPRPPLGGGLILSLKKQQEQQQQRQRQ